MAVKANLQIDQGAKYVTTVSLTNSDGTEFDLTDYFGSGSIRKWAGSSNSSNLAISIESPATSGRLGITFTANASLALDHGRYLYDVTIKKANTEPTRVVQGVAVINPAVTR